MPATQPESFGRFQLLERLGAGGMADVYKARAAGSEREVCLKRIRREHLGDRTFVEMFKQEARISAQLSHPNVVQVYELGDVGGEFFMTLELIRGRDLLKLMRVTNAPLPPAAAALIARDVARALAYAHEFTDVNGELLEIIHRDVSLQNVMIGFDGGVKLVDFGVAKAVYGAGPGTQTGVVKGKFAYLAPEQLRGVKASPRTDIFALGVVLWEMLTGDRLFHTKNVVETLTRLRDMAIPGAAQRNPRVPAALDRITAQALARDPASRYGRASVMARDLEAFCASEGVSGEHLKSLMARSFSLPDVRPDAGPFEGTQQTADPFAYTSAASPLAGNSSVSRAIEAVSDSMLFDVNDLPDDGEDGPAPDSLAQDDVAPTQVERGPGALAAVIAARNAASARPMAPRRAAAEELMPLVSEDEPLDAQTADKTSLSDPVRDSPAYWFEDGPPPPAPPPRAVPSIAPVPFIAPAPAVAPVAAKPAIAPTPAVHAPAYVAPPVPVLPPVAAPATVAKSSSGRIAGIAIAILLPLAGAGGAYWYLNQAPKLAPVQRVRSVRLVSSPAGADVYEGSRFLGTTPLEVHFTEGHEEIPVSVFKQGGAEARVTLTPESPPVVEVKLPEK